MMSSSLVPLSATQQVPIRSIALLAGAGFASQAMVRVTDSLLPQIAADFETTVGTASIVVTAYAVSHGSIQLIIGPLGDRFGKYRTVAVMCALATAGLIVELASNPRTRQSGQPEETRGFAANYQAVLSSSWARFVILAVFIEAVFGWGAFAYVGADLHLRFGLSFSAIGLIVGSFGIGGLLYAASVQQLVDQFGQAGLAMLGGMLIGIAYLVLAIGATWWLAPFAVAAIGFGFYALHNTLQTNATQIPPQAL